SVSLPAGLQAIGAGAFTFSTMTDIAIPDSVTAIGPFAFSYCRQLQNVTIPDGIKYIGEYAFEAKPLKSVTIPGSVKVIYDMAFEECSDLAKINAPDTLERVAPNAVANTKWQMGSKEDFIVLGKILLAYTGNDADVTVPDGVRVIAKQAFNFNGDLVAVHLPDSVIRIEEGAFARCAQLQIMELGENIEVIERKAFEACKFLYYVRFGHHLREIGPDAFLECWKLESVYLPDTVRTVEPHAFGYQFGEDAHTYLKMDNALKIYANAEAVRKYAEEAEIPHEPLPDEENTKPEDIVTTPAREAEKIGRPGGRAWIPAALLGGVLVIGGIAVAVIRGKKEKD
ncbi:MAG: leucine-rich repeat domain-containing protein, partial [Oscillospiraceae bacterium]|nr:leucine-rich repeat domain-containing protein [Oscillospiraceae bacterium]